MLAKGKKSVKRLVSYFLNYLIYLQVDIKKLDIFGNIDVNIVKNLIKPIFFVYFNFRLLFYYIGSANNFNLKIR